VDLSRVSIGLPGATEHALLASLAPRIEELGFRGLWLNDTPQGDSLAGLEVVASVTTSLRLATGVIPFDRRPASAIVAALGRLPADRLELGVGAGGPQRALKRVREGVSHLRAETSATIVVGALGPRMRALGAEIADGLLLSWLTPLAATLAVDELKAVNPAAPAVLYARTIVHDDARPALEHEAAQYASYPSYAANFERIGASAIETTIDGSGPGALAEITDAYLASVDELVLRAVTAPGTDLVRFVERAAS
jgi:alkanesulfonate monooxygenase SsuD/methylene tetrahydromethanopterin reductase-like flavin-dependent oxidoreductase (luciferase family)